MRESQRIKKLYTDIYNGSPWIDVNLVDTLKKISADIAVKKTKETNSIWQIVNHIIEWRENVLQRVKGASPVTPAHNYFTELTDTSEKAWQHTLSRLETSQVQWINMLENFDEKEFNTLYPGNQMSYYENIQGILQHDAYHLGQIVILAKING